MELLVLADEQLNNAHLHLIGGPSVGRPGLSCGCEESSRSIPRILNACTVLALCGLPPGHRVHQATACQEGTPSCGDEGFDGPVACSSVRDWSARAGEGSCYGALDGEAFGFSHGPKGRTKKKLRQPAVLRLAPGPVAPVGEHWSFT